MFTEIGNLEEGPENEWGNEHAQKSGQADLFHHRDRDFKTATDEAKEEKFNHEVEEDGHCGEDSRKIPFSLFEDRLDPLHEKTHESVEKNSVAELHRLSGSVINGCVNLDAFFRGERGIDDLLSIPKEAPEEGEQEHAGGRNGDRSAGYDKWDEQNARVIGAQWGEELLNNATQEKESNETDVVE